MFGNLVLVLLCVSFIFIAPSRFDWDQIYCLCAFMGIIAISFNVTPKRQVKLGYPGLLLLLALITLAMSFLYYKLLIIFYCCIGFMTIKVMAERLEDNFIKKLGYFMAAFCAASIVYVQMQLHGLDTVYQPTFQDFGGSFGKPWALGCMAVMAIPFIWNVNKFLCILPGILVYYSHSSSCVLAACIVLICLLPRRYCLFGLGFLVIAVSSYIWYEGEIESHRLQVWKNVWPYAMERPIHGHGIGSFLHGAFLHITGTGISKNYHHWPWLHNEFYQYFYEQGIIGLSILAAWLISLLLIEDKIIRIALLGFCIVCFFHPVMHWGRLIFFGCLIITLAEIAKTKMRAYGRRYERSYS